MVFANVSVYLSVYRFVFDHFFRKTHGFYFNQNNVVKNKNLWFPAKQCKIRKMLRSKIVHLKEIYNIDFDLFLIKRTVFVLIVKNFIENQKFNFPDKLCDIQKNVKEQNCLFQKDLQISF